MNARPRLVVPSLLACLLGAAATARAAPAEAPAEAPGMAGGGLPAPRSPVLSARGTVVPTAALPDDRTVVTLDAGPFFQGVGVSYAGIVEGGVRATLLGAAIANGVMIDATLKAQVLRARYFRLALRAGRFAWYGRYVNGEHALYGGATASLCFDEDCASSFSVGGLGALATDELDAGPRDYGLLTPNAVLLVTPYVSRFGAVHLMAEVQRLPVGNRYRDSWIASVGGRLSWQRVFVDVALMGYVKALSPEGVAVVKLPYVQAGIRF